MNIREVRPGDWETVRINFQRLGSILFGANSSPTFAGLTLTDLTANSLIYPNSSKVLTSLGAATNGQIPIGSTGTTPVLAGITGTTNQITVTNGAGSITLSTPQDIHTGASPIFNDLTISTPVNIYALNHDSFTGFVADEHIAHSGVTITAGTGLTGGGTIDSNLSLSVDGLLEDLDTLGASTADGEFLVATGAGTLAWESGATARTSIGLGTGDSPTFAGLSLGTGELTCGSINRATGTLTLEIGGTAEISLTSTTCTLGGNLIIPNSGTIGSASDTDVMTISSAGVTTFSVFPVTPSSAPTTDYQVANKKYVDDNAGGGGTFVDRGDPATRDFEVGDFTTDETWNALDLSSVVPDGAKCVLLSLEVKDDAVDSYFLVTRYGNTNNVAAIGITTVIANQTNRAAVPVGCSSDRKIQYFGKNVAFTSINMIILGWWT